MNQLLRGALFGAFVLIAAACGSDSPSGPDPEPTPSLQCTSPALGATEAVPFARVALTGVGGIDEDTWVEYETASGTKGATAIVPASGGGHEIVVPAHPDALMAGGTLTLTVTDGTTSCASLSIDVLPTAPVEGDPLGDATAALGELADALAAQFGFDPATVRATTLDQLAPAAVPVAVLLEAFDGMEPATVLSSMTADEAAFVQAMVAGSGIVAVLEAELASVQALGLPVAASAGPAGPVQVARREGCTDLGAVSENRFDIDSPQELSNMINAARGAGDPNGPLNQAINGFGAAFGAVGLAAPNVGLVAGYLTFTAQLVQKMRANLYPSSLTRLEYQLDETRIEEDWDTSDGDPEIKWRFAKLWAVNNGMSLARVGLDLIAAGAPIPTPMINGVAGGLIDIAAKDKINKRLDELEKDPDAQAECWGIGTTEFGPVVVDEGSGDQWVRAEVTAGDAIAVDGADNRKINPVKIGTATLRVRSQEEPFPGPFAFEDKPVEVLRKQVVWIPRTLIVDKPGQDVTIKFRVDNSKHNESEDVEITEGPNLPPMFPSFAGGVHEITFTTPSEEDAYPTWVEARSTSKELPPGTPARVSRIEIFAKEFVEIDKKDVCVGSGESETFTATGGGPGEPVIMWELVSGAGTPSSGSGPDFTYTAPSSGSGQATLRAYLSTNSEVEDFITFSYGVCGGLAAWWGHVSDIGFPFTPGGECGNPDLDVEFEELTLKEDAFEPDVRPAGSDILVGRTQTFNQGFSDFGPFGDIPPGSESCLIESFQASSSYEGSLTGSASGTRLDIDFNVDAMSEAKQMGELGNQWSSAGAAMTVGARWDFDVTTAMNYRLQVQLDCEIPLTEFGIPLSGMLSIVPIHLRQDGSFAPVNFTTQPIQIQATSGVPIVVDQVMEFVAPNEGETDHILFLLQMGVVAVGAGSEDSGEVSRSGFVKGFVSVDPQ